MIKKKQQHTAYTAQLLQHLATQPLNSVSTQSLNTWYSSLNYVVPQSTFLEGPTQIGMFLKGYHMITSNVSTIATWYLLMSYMISSDVLCYIFWCPVQYQYMDLAIWFTYSKIKGKQYELKFPIFHSRTISQKIFYNNR